MEMMRELLPLLRVLVVKALLLAKMSVVFQMLLMM
jgi:hypothetical protein